MSKRRVVITGLGALAPNGNSVADFWSGLLAGKSGIQRVTYFDTENFSVRIAGELSGFNAEDYFDRKEIRKLDPFSIYGLVTATEAIEHSGLDVDAIDHDRAGVIIGSGVGGIQTLEDQHKVMLEKGSRRISPYFVPKMVANIAAGQIAIKFGLRGPNYTVVSACSSGSDAIGQAFRKIQYGETDIMLTGGSEASVTPLTIAGFGNMKALSASHNDEPEKASRPFDKDRDGFVLGEGAGILVMESLEHAQARGAHILAELTGYGATDDAFHITQPAEGGSGAVKAIKLALEDAGTQPEDIDYINAHGTSTPFNDKSESAAIRTVFGAHADFLKVSSTKSMTGHLLGASGAIAAVACVKALENNKVPPTINYTTPDPECDLDYVPNTAQELKCNTVMLNAFGFGGHNAILVIKAWSA
ncbi:MAG TPA: beta-ketoacyl-ACP synthase II [Candidatus Marinimicrobia bacterium]|mgnify:CR=1 FL=1|jgi:3-oxoacyl-[acyl-carrier-protein] synthase II|nr:beta-ketoacyl-ACP synthase II [Candidatus Neomarinimicrobiota bacterium]MDP7217206.1 beta-ketoacyl-ACP synthase II [Candidatus Neomarinimicrobiota bacterium]MDP7437586.1 beta-ketoacyl-ACP synthase II [Candidatus Neomarinimicrobiota bacterium]MDP7653309.1 beta-ketoacyl-ACP synthase II [Candidatus Neomarinimicrobiota bacterium]HBN46003.1 beta-ketoacyl-[acyl-carrier-protein] synthase II [Candidatus Neomarinimicrobiota bacterium]|tara:strand:- start:8564 stop:9811 length:1248 start_codon:yes stop_codon:yes gene_type:complete